MVQLGEQVLKDLAEGLRTGTMRSLWQHDIRRPSAFQILDAGVRQRGDGVREVWALADVDADEWAQHQAELAAAGAPGGMSFSGSEPLGELSSQSPDDALSLNLAADRGHWTDEEILAAAEELRSLGPVSVGRRFEFAHDPRAVVDLWLAWKNYGEPIVLGAGGNFLFAALRRFLRLDKPTIFHLTIEEENRTIHGHLETHDTDVLKRAIDALAQLASRDEGAGPATWTEPEGLWLDPPAADQTQLID